MMPGISTLAVRSSKFASRLIGRNNVSQNSMQVDAKTEKKLLKGAHAPPEIIVSSATRCTASARSSIMIWRLPFPSLISPGHLYSPAHFSPAGGVSLKWPSTMFPTKAD